MLTKNVNEKSIANNDSANPPSNDRSKLKTLGMNKLYELSTVCDDASLLNVATMVELKADLISTEEIQKMVQETKYAQFKIVEELGTIEENPPQEDVAQPTGSEAETNEEKLETASSAVARFQEVMAKVSSTLQEVGATVSQVSTHGFRSIDPIDRSWN